AQVPASAARSAWQPPRPPASPRALVPGSRSCYTSQPTNTTTSAGLAGLLCPGKPPAHGASGQSPLLLALVALPPTPATPWPGSPNGPTPTLRKALAPPLPVS